MSDKDYTQLDQSPYLIPMDTPSRQRFSQVLGRSRRTKLFALDVQRKIKDRAGELLKPLSDALRYELVAESNQIEGYNWTPKQVKAVAIASRELLSEPIHLFVTGLKHDERVFEALGLYKAHELAEEWAGSGKRPREYEIRSLHELVAAGEKFAGRYKTSSNTIGGSQHRPTDPMDVPREMKHLVDWWSSGGGDPVLEATVVHAWLTHIHPFEDGNGRMARLLANLTLVQSGYPPLILNSGADKGQYYDALASSDGGDILPLYDLFCQVVRRTVKMMSNPRYVEEVLEDRLYGSVENARQVWEPMVRQFHKALNDTLILGEWSCELMGMPSLPAFGMLTSKGGSTFGNGWFLKVFDENRVAQWLLWFGFNTNEARSHLKSSRQAFPSIFISKRNHDPLAQHPFAAIKGDSKVPSEVVISPISQKQVLLIWQSRVEDYSIYDAVQEIADCLTRSV